MITFDNVTVTYDDASSPALVEVNLEVPEGELALVVGPTGSGKSTLLGMVNGLVPHFTGGNLVGRVMVDGRDTRSNPPRELADIVGVVTQDPLSGFVTDTVEEELAYGMEQLAVPPDVMRKRVEETLDLLGIADLRDRALHQLSGGQQQRVAIASVLTAHPRVLVMDEPTSALDPTAAEEILAAITRLVHDLSLTVLLAEHRLERVIQYADRVIEVHSDKTVTDGPPASMLATTAVFPPIIDLGRSARWDPLPLSVRDARRRAGNLRDKLSDRAIPPMRSDLSEKTATSALSAHNVTVRYDSLFAVKAVDLQFSSGQITAIMGRNGSGKSSLLWALQGSGSRHSGNVSVGGADPANVAPRDARRLVGLVPQTPADLLYLDTVGLECSQSDSDAGAGVPSSTRTLLDDLAPGVLDPTHPRDLSEGQRLALVLAIQLSAAPSVMLLDEPTRGLDYDAKRNLARIVDQLACEGRAVVIATHDVEFVASVADRVLVMAEGEIVADGPASAVMVASPAYAPQVAKILAPLEYLTVDQFNRALAGLSS
jgi:energy-coupling factor transport system ATP-binding protein